MNKIVVYSLENDPFLHTVAEQLKLPLVGEISAEIDFYLSLRERRLSLTNLRMPQQVSINVNFSSGASTHRREQGGGKNQALAKAIGLNKKNNAELAQTTVLDATAGLAKDAFVIATLGCVVTMVEQSPIVAALLRDGLDRGMDDIEIQHIVENMNLVVANSIDYMRSDLLLKNPPDVVYLDPMYPERKKSAKVKKEMQTLQRLLGHKTTAHQDDLETLLSAALQCANKRVVVKRPKGAQSLSARPPAHTIESKKTRYDVYMCV